MSFQTLRLIVPVAFLLLFPLQAFSQSNIMPDAAQAEQNRQMVIKFYNQLFNQHDLSVANYVDDSKYIQHNPLFADGKAAFINGMIDSFKKFPKRQNIIVRSIASGDMVYLHVHRVLTPGDRGDAIVDIYRIENGKLVEHWDVIQPVPEKAANVNSMF